MPAPEPVVAALRLALCDGGLSSATLTATAPPSAASESAAVGARASLLESVEFEEAGDYQADAVSALKQKYLFLKRETVRGETAYCNAAKGDDGGLPTPKRVLFAQSAVRPGYSRGWQVGAGMQNFGNTCYLNSTLQALFHVSAFANWLVSENHSDDRCAQGGCIICGMRKTLADTQNSSGPVKPWQVYNKLRFICRHLTPGRQEDAHEFLRYLVEAMEKAYLSQFDGAVSQLDQYSKETTPLNQILGGYLRSVVRCLACGRASTTFQHFQDLLVDARKASAIDEALETFFSRERLEDLGYKCEFCNKKVSATKQFYVERAPMVLCIALKRFSITGGKLTKHVQFRPRLSLNKYMFDSNGSPPLEYRLASIVTHLGQSQNCGHYTAAGVGPGGSFHQFDDTCVREIPMSQVLNTNAYILFYELGNHPNNNPSKINVQSVASSNRSVKEAGEAVSNFIGPIMPKNFKRDEENDAKSTATPLPDRSSNGDYENSLNGSKVTFVTVNYRNEENGSNDSSKEKVCAGITPSTSMGGEQKLNGTLKINNNNENGKPVFGLSGLNSSSSNANSSPQKTNGVKSSIGSFSIYNSLVNKKSIGSDKKLTNGSATSGDCANGPKSDKSISSICKLTNGNSKMCESKVNGSSENKTICVPNKYDFSDSNGNKVKVKSGETNGSSAGILPLVPYDSESSRENHDDLDEDKLNPIDSNRQKQTSSTVTSPTKATSQGWKVSRESPDSRMHTVSEKNSNKSQLSNELRNKLSENVLKEKETVGQLQRLSHHGYGAPVSTWNGTHAQLNRQVYEDKKSELKRAGDADDEIDRGRTKKRKFSYHPYHKYDGRSNHNSFQEMQNQTNKWGDNRKFHRNHRNYKQKNRGRFNSHYPHHHSNNRYHHPYSRNH